MQIGAPRILKAIALGLGLMAGIAALVELGRSLGNDRTTPAALADPLSATLARCRDLAPEAYARATDCRAAWEESRRRFFGPPPVAGDAPIPEPDAEPVSGPARTE